MKQDFEYKEESFEVKSEESKTSSIDSIIDENIDTDVPEESKKKLIIIIADIVIVVILVIVLVFMFKGKLVKKESVEVSTEEETTEIPKFEYTYDEYERLRTAGFTASEIEDFELQEIADIDTLINEAEEKRKKKFLETYKAFIREANESPDSQYTYLMANTYLGLPPQEIDLNSTAEDYYSETRNVDYWKMPLQGYQPLVKVRIMPEDVVLYVNIKPENYALLRDSGNMVISYDFVHVYGCDFYTNIKIKSAS